MKPRPFTPGTQNYRIHRYLSRSRGRKLTQLQALPWFKCLRLASRIKEIKRRGHRIGREMVHRNGKVFAAYFLKVARR